MANLVRERLHGNVTYFNVNRHINPTDVCVASCRLCAFGKRAKDPKAYTMSLEQAWETAGSGWSEGVTEFHVVGGLHPELTLDWYCEMFRGLKQRFPQVHLKALTMVEIAYLARRTGITVRETLERMKAAGVDSLPGGGAEIFSERVRRIICDHKIGGDEWLEVARAAHQAGLRSNCTMLYGHIETDEDRVDHLMRLRALQDETGGFMAFIPLPFHPEHTRLAHLPAATGFADLKNIAVSRLMLDNIPHIKAYWVGVTPADRAGCPTLRRGRHGRDRGGGEDLPRRGLDHQPISEPRRDVAPHPRGGPRAGGAGHALQPRRPSAEHADGADVAAEG